MKKIVLHSLVCLSICFVSNLYASEKNLQYADPTRGILFKLPSETWDIKWGWGNDIVRLKNKKLQQIYITLRPPAKEAMISDQIMIGISQKYPDARTGPVKSKTFDGKKIWSAAFEFFDRENNYSRGVKFYVNLGQYDIEMFCDAPKDRFMELFFQCQRIINSFSNFDSAKYFVGDDEVVNVFPSPEMLEKNRLKFIQDQKSFQRAAEFLQTKAFFAFFDGAGTCPGVVEEVVLFEDIARKMNRPAVSRLFNELALLLKGGSWRENTFPDQNENFILMIRAKEFEDEGRFQSAREIYERLAAQKDGFFANLQLARLGLDDGDIKSGRRRLLNKGPDQDSQLAGALMTQLARLEGDLKFLETKLKEPQSSFCGPSGAITLYQLGMAISEIDSTRAEAYFTKAIDADPSYVPSYFALGRLYLNRGVGAKAATERLKSFLVRAPNSLSLKEIKEKIEKLE